jgi:hypothetical protein
MIQYNISLFVENSIQDKAELAIKQIILPDFEKQIFIQNVYLFEIEYNYEQMFLFASNCADFFSNNFEF